jgi:hypothetical protein
MVGGRCSSDGFERAGDALARHPGERRDPAFDFWFLATTATAKSWIPAFAGMTSNN